MRTDRSEYEFLTAQGASIQMTIASERDGVPEIRIFGNRAGLLSLANVLLWMIANNWRRELMSLNELPFVQSSGSISLLLRLLDDNNVSAFNGRVESLKTARDMNGYSPKIRFCELHLAYIASLADRNMSMTC